MPTNSSIELPEFLRSYSDFLAHLDEHFEVLDNQGRGDIFLGFSLRLLPLIDEWTGFELPLPSDKKTHDGVFFVSFQIVAEKALDVSSEGRDTDILQKMYKEISGANFQNLFRLLRLRMKGDLEIGRLEIGLDLSA